MKTKFFIFTLLLMGALLTACEKSDIEYDNDFGNSHKAWLSFKQSSNNSYRYMVAQGSVFGSSTETVITIKNGKITQRHFKYTSLEGTVNLPAEMREWTENENEINTHNVPEALTLDQVYEKAKTDWLLKRKDADTYFEAKNNGIISSCGYVEKGCMDDCFIGIHVAYVEALQ
ncbi:hypothetical protein [Pedobacter immunditicola]|uniref:hypothetical protein n=1 Tax=Pedobacter immunditicola TaxID=3133440 RepID=UPI0030B18376